MKKAVCYFMTRNIYGKVLPSLKSLLKNGNIDEVFLMIEDDGVGYPVPEKVKCVNVGPWKGALDPNGPNYQCRWSYMVMMKVLLCRMFPDRSRIVSLDVDTIVVDDISGMWDIDMEGMYIAGAREWYWSGVFGRDCINAGVLMWNLDMMRDGMAEKVVGEMNRRKFRFVEQDALSEMCAGKMRIMDSAYNFTEWTDPPQEPLKIIHFAAFKEKYMEQQVVKDYLAMTWEEAMK